MDVTVPVDGWRPRDYQMDFWRAMEAGCKRAVCVWHRRAGKDLTHLNWTATQLVQRVGAYWHLFPNATQGRRIAWEGMTKDGVPFLQHLPGADNVGGAGSFCYRSRDDIMKLWFANNSTYQVLGAENVDSLVGAGPVGIVVSELAVYNDLVFWDLLRPILVENGGWVVFNFTPRGENFAHSLLELTVPNRKWFTQVLTVDDTRMVTEEQIQEERDTGMPEATVQQEYYCSFKQPLLGAFYGDLMATMEDDKRICRLPIEATVPVWTWWDCGVDDPGCVWFVQFVGHEVRFIDFLWNQDKGLDYYAKEVKDRQDQYGYTFADHLVPWDLQQRAMETGRTRLKFLQDLLGHNVRTVSKLHIKDGIQAARAMLPRVWIDKVRCADGIAGLKAYKRQQVQGQSNPDGTPMFSETPVHDWASHPADALRTGAVGTPAFRAKGLRRPPPPPRNVAIV